MILKTDKNKQKRWTKKYVVSYNNREIRKFIEFLFHLGKLQYI